MRSTEETMKWVDAVLDEVTYKDSHSLRWAVWGDVLSLWWEHMRPDCITGEMGLGLSGVTYIPVGKIRDTEHLLRLVFSTVKALEEHEAREFFKWRGKRTFNPHIELMKSQELWP